MYDNTEDYTEIAKKRKFRNKQNVPQKSENDNFGSTANPSARAASGAIQTAASGGSAADVASSGLMASGNPYALGVGAGLAVLSAGAKRKQQEQEAKAIAKQQRIERQQRALENLTSVSQNLRRL